MNHLLNEIRRRRLFGVLALYFVGAWVALQAAALLFPGWQIPDEAIRYVWIGAMLLFPVAVWFSWRYDVSSKGISATPARDEEPRPLNRRDASYLSVAAVIALIVLAGVSQQILQMRDAPNDSWADSDIPFNSVAVLPFVNMSDDPGNEYFSDGITEQLLHELAAIPNLHVAARTSAFYFKGRNEDMRTIGRALGVRTLLEGSVRKAGNSLRITAQLINAEDGFHLWSQVYDAELSNIFTIQDEIAASIVSSLQIDLREDVRERLYRPDSASPESFDLYLRALAHRQSYDAAVIVQSNEMLEQVIDESPEFASAYAQLAYGYILLPYYDYIPEDEAANLAEPLLTRALELQPDLVEAYDAWGVLFSRLRRFDDANAAFEQGLEINPQHYGTLSNYGLSLVFQSRLQEASAKYLQALAIDPMNANLSFNLGALSMLLGNYDSGRSYMERAIHLDPSRKDVKATLAVWSRRFGRLDVASALSEELHQASPADDNNNALRAELSLDFGDLETARRIIEEARQESPNSFRILGVAASVWLAEGDIDAFTEFTEEQYAMVDAVPGAPLSHLDLERVIRFGWLSLLRGENQQAAENFYWAAGGDEGIESTTYDYMRALKFLALAYRRTGRIEDSDALTERCLALSQAAQDGGWATPQLYYRTAEIHAIREDVEGAATFLNLAFDRGWRDITALEGGVFWEAIADAPEIERVKVMIYEDIERQRAGI